jgi:hypothetical protein
VTEIREETGRPPGCLPNRWQQPEGQRSLSGLVELSGLVGFGAEKSDRGRPHVGPISPPNDGSNGLRVDHPVVVVTTAALPRTTAERQPACHPSGGGGGGGPSATSWAQRRAPRHNPPTPRPPKGGRSGPRRRQQRLGPGPGRHLRQGGAPLTARGQRLTKLALDRPNVNMEDA